MDYPRKGACSFSEDTANLDSRLLYQSQSHENSQDEDDIERVVIEAAYLDDVIISTTSEEEISKQTQTIIRSRTRIMLADTRKRKTKIFVKCFTYHVF